MKKVYFLIAVLFLLLVNNAFSQTLYWRVDGTSATLTSSNWSTTGAAPYTSAWVNSSNIIFSANSAITNVTNIPVGNVTISGSSTVTLTAAGTYSTGGAVRTFDIGTGSTLAWNGQNVSTTAGTGFIKNGDGTWNIGAQGNTYTGGVTINAGTVIVGGANALGSGGALTINGGTLAPNSGTARDYTGKFGGGITWGGNFTLGIPANTGHLTFSNATALGTGVNRILTIGSTNATTTYTFSGVISGSGSGIEANTTNAGVLLLSGTNTYTGSTTVSGGITGELRLNPSANNSLSGTCNFNGGRLSTTGIAASRTLAFSSIDITDNSTLSLAAATAHTITFTNAGTFTAGKILTITGWTGASYYTGTTSGTNGKVFIGNSASLTDAELDQIRFYDGTSYFAATQLNTGQIVPTLSLVITAPVTQTAGSPFSVTVTTKDLSGNIINMVNGVSIALTTNGNAGSIGGTTTGSIAAGASSVTISGVVMASAGTLVTITATRSSGTDYPNAGTSATFTVTGAVSPILSGGSLTAFGSQCINNTYGPNSFTLSGSVLDGSDVTINTTSGFTFSTTSGGTYTSSLVLTTAGTDYTYSSGTLSGCTIYVKFYPTTVSSYSNNILISGGGASSINVAASGSGINTTATINTPAASNFTTTTADAGATISSIGCSNVTERGIYWSITSGFTAPAGTKVSASGTFGTGAFTVPVSGLPGGTIIYYQAYATNNGGTVYTTEASFTTVKNEPTNQPTLFACGTPTNTTIPLTWTDASGGIAPDGYIIKWSSTSYAAISDPVDGTAEADGVGVKNIAQGVQAGSATSLATGTTYYIKIWSYTNNGTNVNYNLTLPLQTSCTTTNVATICGSETFTNSALTNTYATGSFTGDNGVTWSYVNGRNENNDLNGSGINGKALMFSTSTSAKITSSSVSNGIGDFSVTLYKGFTGAGNRQVSLYVNSVLKATSTGFDDLSPHTFAVSGINVSGSVIIEIRNAASEQVIIDDISWTCYAASPTITTSLSGLTGFSYESGSGPSPSQSFTVSGANLTGNVVLTPPTNYEISSNNTTFTSSPITLTQSGGIVGTTTMYVRLKSGLAINTYNAENINISSTGATTKTIGLSGDVVSPTPTIIVSVSTLSGFTYVYGSGPSGVQSFTVSGTTLTNNIEVNASSNYEISTTNAPFTSVATITLTQSGGTVSATTIYVRLASGLLTGVYNSQSITCVSTGATTKSVVCSGNVSSIISTCITQGFSGGITAPSGWTFTAIEAGSTYTTSGFYGAASPAIQFNDDDDQIETTSLTTGYSANALSFWLKGNSTNSASSFKVEGYNGTTWVIIENISPLPTSGTTKLYNSSSTVPLPSGLTKFRFTYTKGLGNAGFDDLTIDCTTDCTTPVVVTNASAVPSSAKATISWVSPVCYDNILVVVTNSGGITFSPSGTSYSANAMYAVNDQVVYYGTGSSVIVTGLTNNTTYYFEIFTRKGNVWSAGVEVSVTPLPYTKLYPGDLVIVGFDTYVNGGQDKYSITNLVDIAPGTPFILANAVYETGQAAYTSSGRWYNGNGNATYTVPRINITYNGTDTLTKGSIICITLASNGSVSGYQLNGVSTTLFSDDGGLNVQISSSVADAIWLMQGTFTDYSADAVGLYSTFSGKVLGGIQSRGTFKSFSVSADAISTRISRIHPDIICLGISTGGTSAAFYAQYKSTASHSGSQHTILTQIADVATNWTIAGTTGITGDGDNVSTCGNTFTITTKSVPGNWIGGSSSDWFYCGNWDNFQVPDTTIDVTISSTATNISNIDITANSANASIYNYKAYANNLTIDNNTLTVKGTSPLYAHGALTIQNDGELDMADGGNIYLKGNWQNLEGLTGFTAGTGTITFNGSLAQIITTIDSNEIFNNIIISNSDTSGVTLNSNTRISGGLTITENILDADLNTLDGSGTLTMSANTILKLSKNEVTQPELTGTYTLPGGTIILNGSSSQTLRNANYYNVTSTSIGERVLSTAGTIGIANTFTPNYPTQSYTVTGSNVDFNGVSAAQNIPAFTFYNVGFKNGNTKTLIGSDTVYRSLTLGNSPTVSDGTVLALGNYDITLHSDNDFTAYISRTAVPLANVTYGTGRFNIERYLPMQTPYSGRRWRLMGVPIRNLDAPTIKAAWQEGAIPTSTTTDITSSTNPHPTYGTHITNGVGSSANGKGFDAGSTANPSIYKMNPGTGLWSVPDSTNGTGTAITDYNAYMLFVRGDRSIQVSSAYINTTGGANLRIKGKINVGDVARSIVANRQLLSNPYPSAISLAGANYGASTIGSVSGRTYYLWDPKLLGSKNVGGFVTFSSNGNNTFAYVPYADTIPYNVGLSTYTTDGVIESGAAFMIDNTIGASSFTFHESDKKITSSTIGLASRPVSGNRPIGNISAFYTNLIYVDKQGTPILADGVATLYGDEYDNEVSEEDSKKMLTFQTKERISLLRTDSILAIERRQTITKDDTIFLQINKLDPNFTYQLQFISKNFNKDLTAYLIDKYLNEISIISIEGNSIHNFETDNASASMDINRFMVVFKLAELGIVPVSFSSVSATLNNSRSNVEWKLESETNLKYYTVERSTDGIHFTSLSTITANGSGIYNYIDENVTGAITYYRIIGVTNDDVKKYSVIVSVKTINALSSITLAANPLNDGVVGLQLINVPTGNYGFALYNNLGQLILKQKKVIAGSSNYLTLGHVNAKGIYSLEIIRPDHTIEMIKVLY
ncbi:MAG: autotransporter-associated beta strand repeat-containing protein [Bacteroidota bacterium]